VTTEAAGAALDDPGTATLLGVYWRRVQAARKGMWAWPMILAGWLVLILSMESLATSARVAMIAVIAPLALLLVIGSARMFLQLGRWLPAAERLLRQEPWRPVQAKVLTWDRTPVLELAGLGCVRLARSQAAMARTIELTGGVDVVGPDSSGWAAVRVAGSCWPMPARAVAPVQAMPRPSTMDDAAGPAGSAADPIVASLAAASRRRARFLVVIPAVVAAFGVALTVIGFTASDAFVSAAAGICLVLLMIKWAVRNVRPVRVIMGLPAQLAAAPWTACPVQLNPWQAPRGLATATGHLNTPFGDVLTFELPRANYDLLTAVTMSGTMHVAGTPKPGVTLPVGVPERPVFGYVRFSAAGGRT
jgi:hypothetical protein